MNGRGQHLTPGSCLTGNVPVTKSSPRSRENVNRNGRTISSRDHGLASPWPTRATDRVPGNRREAVEIGIDHAIVDELYPRLSPVVSISFG